MSRLPRIIRPGTCYHITSRGNNRQNIFWSDSDRHHFSKKLGEYLQEFKIELMAGVLMTNHFHLLIQLNDTNLSAFMQRLLTSYSMYVRKRHDRVGHLFQGRYHAKLVQDDRYLIRLSRYLHLNPVKTDALAQQAEQQRLEYLNHYRWSTYRAYLGIVPPASYLNLKVLTFFGDSPQEAQLNYQKFVLQGLLQDDEMLRISMKASTLAIGDDEYIRSVEKEIRKQRSGDIGTLEIRLPHQTMTLEQIEQLVCEHFNIPANRLKMHGLYSKISKSIAIELACRWSGLTNSEIGAYFGGITGQAVSLIRRRINQDDRIRIVSEIEAKFGGQT